MKKIFVFLCWFLLSCIFLTSCSKQVNVKITDVNYLHKKVWARVGSEEEKEYNYGANLTINIGKTHELKVSSAWQAMSFILIHKVKKTKNGYYVDFSKKTIERYK